VGFPLGIFMIPKIIHQIWIGPKKPPYEWLNTWKEMHPEWEYILWDNDRVEKFIPEMRLRHLMLAEDTLSEDERREKYNVQSDYLRFEILYKYGGVYLDADTYCLRKIPNKFLLPKAFTCYLNEEQRPGRLASGILGAEPQHPLLDRAIELLAKKTFRDDVGFKFAGPTFFTSVVGSDDIFIFPSKVFLPFFFKPEEVDLSESICVHFWGTTDRLSGGNISNKIVQALGLGIRTTSYADL